GANPNRAIEGNFPQTRFPIHSRIMKVLLIGSGGREHALAWKLADSPHVSELFALPGNPGIAQLADVVPGSVNDFKAIEAFIKKAGIEFVVIGPEDPLAAGMAER